MGMGVVPEEYQIKATWAIWADIPGRNGSWNEAGIALNRKCPGSKGEMVFVLEIRVEGLHDLLEFLTIY